MYLFELLHNWAKRVQKSREKKGAQSPLATATSVGIGAGLDEVDFPFDNGVHHPKWDLLRYGGLGIVLFLFGLLPQIDNFAHILGFLYGFGLSMAIIPYATIGKLFIESYCFSLLIIISY